MNLFLMNPQKGAKFAIFKNRIFFVAFLVCMSLLFISPALGKEISIMIPRDVLAQLIRDTLPVHVPIKEKGFSGNIWIESIQNLVLGDNEVAFVANIRGEDIRYLRKIRNRPLDLRFGNIKMLLECRGALRYDPEANTLFVTPYAKEEIDKEKSSGMIMGISPLIAALSGVEYPLRIQELKPMITQLGGKKLKIDLMISDIHTKDNMLFIEVKPSIEEYKTK